MPTRSDPRPPAVRDLGRAAVLTAVTLLAAAGCTDSGDPRPRSGASATSERATPVTAADGTNVSACTDGNCEILVSRPVDIDLGGHGAVKTLSVVKVDPSGLSFKTTSDGGTGSGDIEPGCTVRFYEGGQGSACVAGAAQPPPEKVDGVVTLQLASATRDGVVLRIVSGKIGSPPPSLVPRLPSPPSFQ